MDSGYKQKVMESAIKEHFLLSNYKITGQIYHIFLQTSGWEPRYGNSASCGGGKMTSYLPMGLQAVSEKSWSAWCLDRMACPENVLIENDSQGKILSFPMVL